MITVAYNQVLNAFIDTLPFEKIPNNFKNGSSLETLRGRDGVCAAVKIMTLEWEALWGRSEKNFEKIQITEHVEESRALLLRKEEEKEIIDETRMNQLLSDMVPKYKDGTYQRILAEREAFLVTQMSLFLQRLGIPVPQIINQYQTEHEGSRKR